MSEPASREHAVFDVPWLELREPLDHRSRDAELVSRLRRWWETGPGADTPSKARSGSPSGNRETSWPGRVVDLGSGTGSNLRYLAPRLSGPQRWTLVDRDSDLLRRATAPRANVDVQRLTRDLGPDPGEVIRDAALVTGSALLDLTSRTWLAALLEACRTSRAAAYFALTYDGTFRWETAPYRNRPDAPNGPGDAGMRRIVNAHQRRDKGLGGVALGPDAVPVAAELFEAAGFRTLIRPSPWRLGPEDSPVARRLLDGWEAAALEERPRQATEIRSWARARQRTIDGGSFALTVGHLDLLALAPGSGRRE